MILLQGGPAGRVTDAVNVATLIDAELAISRIGPLLTLRRALCGM